MQISRWKNFPRVKNTAALARTLRNREDVTAAHSALVKHAWDLAACLDSLEDGYDLKSGRLEIVRLSKEYRATLEALGVTAKPEALRAATAADKESRKPDDKCGEGVTALDAFRRDHGVA